MRLHHRIFTDKFLDIRASQIELDKLKNIKQIRQIITDWQIGIENQKVVYAKEESLQADFLNLFFGEILGYEYSQAKRTWHLEKEQKTLTQSKMDGALGFFSWKNKHEKEVIIRAVIELKDARTDLDKPQRRQNDHRTPIQQAFDYANAVGGTCRWVIVSNFLEIRLYFHTDRTHYEVFEIMDLHKDEVLKRFLYLFHYERMIFRTGDSIIDTLYKKKQEAEEAITHKLYKEYKGLRNKLYKHFQENHPKTDKIMLINKSQKILDRVIFLCFCEDFGIIPYYTLRTMLKNVKADIWNQSESKIYDKLKQLFEAINEGFPEQNINKFNGGLFAMDETLDNLIIKDKVMEEIIYLERYDFATELNVNILGYIFEQSISDIEVMKAGANGKKLEEENGKRKQDGIFYTPEYITKYIVEESIGIWLEERKQELIKQLALTKNNFEESKDFWLHYKQKLINIKVLDPACGSGAFLNQVFDFLYHEAQKVEKELAKLENRKPQTQDLDSHIMENNLYGLDLNLESVEITKLSLWLKTANNGKELSTLDNNILCGNSLIDDPKIAGKKAFDWHKHFPEIMQKGGFDIVVGNPPYVSFQSNLLPKKQIEYFNKNYESVYKIFDLFALFIERSIADLLKFQSRLSFIIPSVLLMNNSFSKLRDFICKHGTFEHITFLGDGVFEEAVVPTIIFQYKNQVQNNEVKINKVENEKIVFERKIEKDFFCENPTYGFNISIQKQDLDLIAKTEKQSISLGNVLGIRESIKTGKDKDFISDKKLNDNYYPLLTGKNIDKYFSSSNRYILFDEKKLKRPTKLEYYLQEKLFIRRVGSEIIATFDKDNYLATHVLYLGLDKDPNYHLKYLLALLNSKLFNYIYQKKFPAKGKIFPEIRIGNLRELPIKIISQKQQKPFIEKAELMLSENQNLEEIRRDFLDLLAMKYKPQKISQKLEKWYLLNFQGFIQEVDKGKPTKKLAKESMTNLRKIKKDFETFQKEALEILEKIEETNATINAMVYKLYNLTDAEIEIVNQA